MANLTGNIPVCYTNLMAHRKKMQYSATKEIKAIARERVGTVRPSRVIASKAWKAKQVRWYLKDLEMENR